MIKEHFVSVIQCLRGSDGSHLSGGSGREAPEPKADLTHSQEQSQRPEGLDYGIQYLIFVEE